MITAVHSAELAGAITLLMVLRDMGNGVIRVEAARLIDRCCTSRDAVPVLFPLSPRIQDCVEVSLELAGAGRDFSFREGFARSVCDEITEVWLW